MYLLEIATGLRRGELLGLKWIDVNYDAGTIYVRRQICRIDGTVTEGPLKTKNSYRKIVVPADVMDVLKKKQAKDDGASEYVFFSPITNGPISPDSILHMPQKHSRTAALERRHCSLFLHSNPSLHPPPAALRDFPTVCWTAPDCPASGSTICGIASPVDGPLLSLRDISPARGGISFATMALQNGVDVKTLSNILGHFSVGFTLDTFPSKTLSACFAWNAHNPLCFLPPVVRLFPPPAAANPRHPRHHQHAAGRRE